MLRREGLLVNRRRTWRLCSAEGLQARTKKRRKLPRRDRVAPQVPERPMQRWSLDLMSDQIADHRTLRILNRMDDHGRFCPGARHCRSDQRRERLAVDLSISGDRMARYLDELGESHSLPEESFLDSVQRARARAMFEWSEQTGVRQRFIEPGRPVQNALVEILTGSSGTGGRVRALVEFSVGTLRA